MEELQDAIEDAQYMNAVHDDSPKPSKPWKFLEPPALEEYIEGVRARRPKALGMETICKNPSGFFLFTQFARHKGYVAAGDFLMDCAKYRSCAASKRLKVAVKMKNWYLVDNSSGRQNQNSSLTLRRILPTAVPNSLGSRDSVPEWRDYVRAPANTRTTEATSEANGADKPSHTPSNPTVVNPVSPPSNVPAKTDQGLYMVQSGGSENTLGAVAELSINGNENAIGVYGQPLAEVLQAITEALIEDQGRISAQHSSSQRVSADRLMTDLPLVNALNGSASGESRSTEGSAVSQKALLQNEGIFVGGGASVKSSSIVKDLPRTLFDTMDLIIYNFLAEMIWGEFENSEGWNKFWQFRYIAEQKVCEEDFVLFRVLGRGGFGMVNMCKRAQSGKIFAMKMMNKKRVKLKKSEGLCLNERNILAAIDSPYVVCLKFAFTTQAELYLIVDLMMGGDMGFHLQRKGRFSLPEVKYFAARIFMGIMALHDKDIVYRDLKPENILMDNDGYTRISDLGLATTMPRNGLTGACGTRGYWAPEMLRRDSNNKRERYFKQVDWFSFGCVVYEFITGLCPFRTPKARMYKLAGITKPTKEERDKSIDSAIMEMEPEMDPGYFSDGITGPFILSLLHKNPTQRLGANGGHEICSHPFFKDIDWDNLAMMRPPWKPARNINMAPQQEIGVFTDEKESNRIVLLNEDQKRYEDWGFVNSEAFEEEIVMFLRYEEMGKHMDNAPTSGCCSLS